jgi:hypothetical protein
VTGARVNFSSLSLSLSDTLAREHMCLPPEAASAISNYRTCSHASCISIYLSLSLSLRFLAPFPAIQVAFSNVCVHYSRRDARLFCAARENTRLRSREVLTPVTDQVSFRILRKLITEFHSLRFCCYNYEHGSYWISGSWDTAVGIATGQPRGWTLSPDKAKIFLLSTSSRPVLGST